MLKSLAEASDAIMVTTNSSQSVPYSAKGEFIATALMLIFEIAIAIGLLGMIIFGFKMLSKKTSGEALDKSRKWFKISLLVFIVPILIVIFGIVLMRK